MSLAGVDVASFQGQPQHWAAPAGQIKWAAVKITELQPNGDRYVNPEARADWAYLKHEDKCRVAYMFGHPATSPSAAGAFFAEQVGLLGLRDGDAIALDHETSDGKPPAVVAAWGRAVLAALEKHFSRTPLLYTYRFFALEGYCAGMGSYPLWLADPDSPPGHPLVPQPWDTHAIHQYKITGGIDRDVAEFATQAELRERLGRRTKPGGPVEYTTTGKLTLAEIARQHGCEPMHILRLTVLHHADGVPANVAAYVNGVFHGQIPVDRHVPAGLHLYVPAA